ncbi:MAG: hypothetical protein ACKODZ_03335 [Verrucomicrobiota bacterium]
MPEPDFDERIRVMTRHLERNIEFFGEERGCILFRKVMPWYARRFGPASSFKKEAVLIRSRQDYDRALKNYRAWREQFVEADGSLREAFQPAKLAAVFAGDLDAVPERSVIPVPKGPVEKW